MRQIAFAALAVMAVATAAQAYAWTTQRFPDAGFAVEAPVPLTASPKAEAADQVLYSYQAEDAPYLFFAAVTRKSIPPARSDAAEANQQVDEFIAAVPGNTILWRRAGPAPNQHEVMIEYRGRRFWFRATVKHPLSLGLGIALPATPTAQSEADGARYINSGRLTE